MIRPVGIRTRCSTKPSCSRCRAWKARVALDRVLSGPLADGVSAVVGDPEWVEYNRDFFRRRWVVPVLGAAVEPAFGTDSLQPVSLVGYVLVGPLLFLLLRRRFGRVVSCAAALACIALPSLRFWSAQPLTDSVAVALEALGLLAAVLVLDRCPRWLPLWFATVLALGFTRDATIVLVAAVAWVALAQRSRRGVELLVTGAVAALPAPLLFDAPLAAVAGARGRSLPGPRRHELGLHRGGIPGRAVACRHRGLRHADAQHAFDRRARRRRARGAVCAATEPDPFFSLARGAALGCLAMILLPPNPTGLRLELVFVPVLAVGLAVAVDGAAGWISRRRSVVRPATTPATPRS